MRVSVRLGSMAFGRPGADINVSVVVLIIVAAVLRVSDCSDYRSAIISPFVMPLVFHSTVPSEQ